MKIFIITRFSIFDPEYRGCKISRDNIHQYKKNLFNKERLDFKFTVFKFITLRSIINQTDKDFEWHIYASIFLPSKYKITLNKLVRGYNFIKLQYINSFEQFNNFNFNYYKYFCTVRLDDDDGLSKKFIFNLRKYKNNDKFIVSFPLGRRYKYYRGKFILGETIKQEKIACGLAAFNMNIHKCGNHNKIDKKYKIIYNYTPESFLLCCSKYCDTKRKFI
jgi:hypothetical protein